MFDADIFNHCLQERLEVGEIMYEHWLELNSADIEGRRKIEYFFPLFNSYEK